MPFLLTLSFTFCTIEINGATGTYLGELLSVGQIVHRNGQEHIQQSICEQLRMHKPCVKDVRAFSHHMRAVLMASYQLVRSSQRNKLLTHPIYIALSAPPDISYSASGIHRAAAHMMCLPQWGKEEGAVGSRSRKGMPPERMIR